MGTDNYWRRGREHSFRIKEADGLNLRSGMRSANGNGSFGGSCYYKIIRDFTSYSLSCDLDNEHILDIADILSNIEYESEFEEKYEILRCEWVDLIKMFRLYGVAGASLEAIN